MRRLVALVILCLLHAPLAGAQAKTGGALVPATQTTRTDSLGFTWEIDPRMGGLRNGSSSFGGACFLQVNGNNFQSRQPMMTADGSEYVLSAVMGGFEVTRHVRLDVKAAGLRTIDSYRNTGSAPAALSAVLRMNLGYQAPNFLSDQGVSNPSALAKNESGLLLGGQPGAPWTLLQLCGPRSKEKPAIMNNSNYEFQFTYSITVPAGKTVALVHTIAQRNVGATDPKALAALFKPFLSRAWIRDVPDAVRRTIANFTGGVSGGDAPADFALLPEDLAALRGSHDVLALGEETRLQGVASCARLSVETAHGSATLPMERVAAALGGKRRGGGWRIFLRDGQALSGTVEAEGLRFTMPSGSSMDLRVEDVDRLVLSVRADAGAAAPEFWGLVETLDGDRLAIAHDPGLRLGLTTPWGPRVVEMGDLARLTFLDGEQPGHQVVLKDGSRFFAFLNDVTWSFRTLLFGVRELRPGDVRALVTLGNKPAEVGDAGEITEPHVVLAGGNILVGRIDLPLLHLVSEGESVPVPPDQIRALHNPTEAGELRPGEALQFTAEMWDGGVVSGALEEAVLPVRRGEWVGRVPARAIVDVFVPVPVVSDAMREKIAVLLRDLGHSEWEKREAASRELEELGSLAKPMLSEGYDQATDPEVRRRVKALLEKAER